ncbi:MAG TPA: M56 family metallopeptidase [Pirellulales bacterium]|jgi:beta-lactamase regulating signal transducer with metallopeptidase domain|nr:M56 family metallopeptidase [Pirellulales bacterium]
MHAIEALLNRPEVERLGWVLLHFFWQGTIGAALLSIVLFALRRASANSRYFAACATLMAMAACLPTTWLVMLREVPTVAGYSSDSAAAAPTGNADQFAQNTVRPVAERSQPEARPPMASTEMNWQQRLATYLPWLAVAWLSGVFALSLRLAIGWSAVHRLRRTASRPLDDARQSIQSRLSQRIGIRWPVKLLESSLVDVPTMIGWLRPVILWPPSVLAGLSVEQFEALLAHELAHVRRHDYLVNLVQTAIETLLFYHPAVWWVSSRIRQERESCCDDLAIATCGNRLSYARALATLEELRPRPRQLALAASGSSLLGRIRRIVGLPSIRHNRSRHWLLGTALSAALLALVIALGVSNFATGDEPTPKSADSPPAKSNETAKPAELPKSQEAPHQYPFDLSVQKLGNSDADDLLPEELGNRIKQIPHVTSVTGSLNMFDMWPCVFGVPSDSPPFKALKVLSGRLPVAADRHVVIVGKAVADKAGYKVGDTMKLFDKVQVIGVVESPLTLLNDSILMPLADLQEFTHAEHRVNEFLVSVDIPKDGSPEHRAQVSEVNARIEALANDFRTEIAVTDVNMPKKPPEAPELREKRTWHGGPNQTDVHFRVVDDETDQPVALFHQQGGFVESNRITWGTMEYINPLSTVDLNWEAGQRARIVAGGYVPQRILAERPKPGATTIEGLVVRMKRGRKVSGRVLDYRGTPVSGASLFVVGALARVKIGGGKAMTEQGDGWTEDDSITRFTTDADGKFTLTGIGWDANYIAVSCPKLDIWVVPAPRASGPQDDFEIRLPQSGKLVAHYDIAGAPDEAEVTLWPSVTNLPYAGGVGPTGPGWFSRRDQQGRPLDLASNVIYGRNAVLEQHGEVVFDNLPPGDYTILRTKQVGFRFEGTMVTLGRHVVKVASGKTAVADFVRDRGAPIAGQVVGLNRDEVVKSQPYAMIVTIRKAVDADDSVENRIDEILLSRIDKDGMPADGKFTTERLIPGQYTLAARIFAYDAWN